ncbi:MAG: S41 family peptidase [Bacteroidales bacterium]
MNNKLRKINGKLRVFLVIILVASSSVFLTGYASRNFEIARNLDIFSSLFRELVVNYVDDINVSDVMRSGIDGMLSELDPYTTFISESEIEDVRFMTTGQYGGIGALIQPRGDRVMVAEPYEGNPAHQAGLLPGDIILEINGRSVAGLDESEVRNLLTGQPGTTIDVLIEREGEPEPVLKSIEREVVQVDNIPYYGMLDESTAYIKLTGFTRNAGREVRDAFIDLRDNHEVDYIVLDLRGNGGGLLNEAVNVANLFIDKGELIVRTEGRLEDRRSAHRTLNDPLDTEIPLAVLIDRRSASASEIVAGAIQDYDRGVIIGDRSFGKGLVQNVVPLSYNTQLKVTVAEYLIPSGRSIQAINYAQRREDGSVAEIPDSLKEAHKTEGGRVVYDGGGIKPDVPVERPQMGQVTMALIRQYMIFDFATRYHREHDELTPPAEFDISDRLYEDFQRFVSGRDFDYKTDSERLLEQLERTASEEKYYNAIEDRFAEVKQNIREEKSKDFSTFRDEITQLLKEEIVSRFYYQEGRVIVSLDADPDVEEALEVLANEPVYSDILAGRE